MTRIANITHQTITPDTKTTEDLLQRLHVAKLRAAAEYDRIDAEDDALTAEHEARLQHFSNSALLLRLLEHEQHPPSGDPQPGIILALPFHLPTPIYEPALATISNRTTLHVAGETIQNHGHQDGTGCVQLLPIAVPETPEGRLVFRDLTEEFPEVLDILTQLGRSAMALQKAKHDRAAADEAWESARFLHTGERAAPPPPPSPFSLSSLFGINEDESPQ